MAEFVGYFLHNYSTALAMAVLNVDVKSLDLDVIVLSKNFSDHRNYETKENDGKRLLVTTDNAPRPFEISLPLFNANGEELNFENCELQMLKKAHITGIEAYLNSGRQQVSFRAKSIKGVK